MRISLKECKNFRREEKDMLRIAICDDDRAFCAELEEIIWGYYTEDNVEVEVFCDGTSLCQSIEQNILYDLIFLDIEMQELNGIETGVKIRIELQDELVQIVYVSWKEDYYKFLFQIRPNNFLLKPLVEKDVIHEIEQAKKLLNKKNSVFLYKKSFETYCVPIKDILYFESMDKKIRMVTTKGEDVFYDQLEKVVQKLKEFAFLQIHKSFVVNLYHVEMFRYEKLKMSNGDMLRISQSKRKMVREKGLEFFRNEEE